MDNKYKFQSACQIEKVETRADNTLMIKIGMQELSVDREVALFALRKLPVNILISPHEITEEDIESVDIISEEDKEFYGKKAKTDSKRQRDILWRVWESLGSKGDFKDFYHRKMNEIAEHLISKYLE